MGSDIEGESAQNTDRVGSNPRRNPENRSRFRTRDFLALGVVGALGFVLLVILVWQVLRPQNEISLGLVGGLAFVMLVLLGWGYLLGQLREFTVDSEGVTLRLPIRLKAGPKIRLVPLDTIEAAVPFASPKGEPGVQFTLKDGTEFVVFRADVSAGAASSLEGLLAKFGAFTSTRRATR